MNWSKNPRPSQRLLDWLDAHAHERDILFASAGTLPVRRGPNALTKRACVQRAAEYVFVDEDEHADEDLQRRVAADPAHFGNVVYFYIRNLCASPRISLSRTPADIPCGRGRRTRYKRFNDKIGQAAANMIYEDINDRVLLGHIRMCTDPFNHCAS